ncbi:MAG: phosphatase PAP2 family protein [Steroidobacteraceae bacterium]
MPLIWATAHAGGGPFGIDYKLALDQRGIWTRSYQLDLEYSMLATTGVGALWLGNDDPVGHEFWQSLDSEVVSGAGAQVLKYVFSRARPYQGDGPNRWFQGHGDESFPSGEVTLQASFVTPFIVDNFRQHPWILALEILPIYDGIARMKSQAHWQSDVIAGWLIGSSVGWWTSTLPVPLSVQILPRGLSIGLSKRF